MSCSFDVGTFIDDPESEATGGTRISSTLRLFGLGIAFRSSSLGGGISLSSRCGCCDGMAFSCGTVDALKEVKLSS